MMDNESKLRPMWQYFAGGIALGIAMSVALWMKWLGALALGIACLVQP